MGNPQELKRKLKASDRRRRRRMAATTPSSQCAARDHGQTPSVDVYGLIVGTILEFVESSSAETRDVAVVAAIRGCFNASSPSGPQAKLLLERIDAISRHPGVEMRSFRSALAALMELAKEHQDPRNSCAFQHYLALLAG